LFEIIKKGCRRLLKSRLPGVKGGKNRESVFFHNETERAGGLVAGRTESVEQKIKSSNQTKRR